jgi:hypothetical protein
MTFVVVLALLLVIAVLPFAGPAMVDSIVWIRQRLRRHGKTVLPRRGERVPQHSSHR